MTGFFAPRHLLYAGGGSTFRSAVRSLGLDRSLVSRRDLSLLRMDSHLAMITPAGSVLPAYGFETIPMVLPARSVSGSFLFAVSSAGEHPCRKPVAGSTNGTRYRTNRLPLLFGALTLRDRSARSTSGDRSLPCDAARSPFAPHWRLRFNSLVASGSSFQVRYRPRGLLSVEPLGTITMMNPRTGCVNGKVMRLSCFQHILSINVS